MSERSKGRRAVAKVLFDGSDISADLKPFLMSLSYTDNSEGETDDLQIQIQDRDGVWLYNWLDRSIQSNDAKGIKIKAAIITENWKGGLGEDVELDCGEFELDSIQVKGPPSTITFKATSLPFDAQIRQTEKDKAWENYTLREIAEEIAGSAGMSCMYESDSNPHYDRIEQSHQTDIGLLQRLCEDAGNSLKSTNYSLVIFDQQKYESLPPVQKIRRGDGSYISYSFQTGSADTKYSSCRVRYTDPATGATIEGMAQVEDEDAKDGPQLEVWAQVDSVPAAKELAAKRLRLHNKYEITGTIQMTGAPTFVAGITIELEDFGMFDGKYIVDSSRHSLGGSGYTTQITIRRVLEGY
jgi:phage protein D